MKDVWPFGPFMKFTFFRHPRFLLRFGTKVDLIPSGLVVHFKIHNEEKLFKGDVCSKKFQRKFDLVSHEKLNWSKDQRDKFECDKRDQTFTQKSSLRQHI